MFCLLRFRFEQPRSVCEHSAQCCLVEVGLLVHGKGLFLLQRRIIDALMYRATIWIVRVVSIDVVEQSLADSGQHVLVVYHGEPRSHDYFVADGAATATFARQLGMVVLGCVCPKYYKAGMCIVPDCRRFCDTLTFI